MITTQTAVVRWASLLVFSALVAPIAARAESKTEPGLLARGAEIFAREWVPGDPRSHEGDGLGPVFNDSSCIACHGLGAPGGAGPSNKNAVILSVISARGFQNDEVGKARERRRIGSIHPGFLKARSVVLHRSGVEPEYAGWLRDLLLESDESSTTNTPNFGVARSNGAKAPVGVVEEMAAIVRRSASAARTYNVERDEQSVRLSISERNTPPLFGAGWIDSVPVSVLEGVASDQDISVRGRIRDLGRGRVGRFGWKAQTGSLREFVLVACAGELGLEVPGEHQASSPLKPYEKPKGMDLSQADCDSLIAYVRTLPAPVSIQPSSTQGAQLLEEGRERFKAVGCADCHAPDLGDLKNVYSDLLLHRMGQSLNDGGEYYGDGFSPGSAQPDEWRTPPLWGFRDSGPYLHDGRARTLDEAVAHHDGQARSSAQKFFELSATSRLRIETFLKSLVAPPTDRFASLSYANETDGRVARLRRAETERLLLSEALLEESRSAAEARADARRILDEARELVSKQNEENATRQLRLNEQTARALATSLWRAESKLNAAMDLERAGKTAGALAFYREIVQDFRDTTQGRLAADRIAKLSR